MFLHYVTSMYFNNRMNHMCNSVFQLNIVKVLQFFPVVADETMNAWRPRSRTPISRRCSIAYMYARLAPF